MRVLFFNLFTKPTPSNETPALAFFFPLATSQMTAQPLSGSREGNHETDGPILSSGEFSVKQGLPKCGPHTTASAPLGVLLDMQIQRF